MATHSTAERLAAAVRHAALWARVHALCQARGLPAVQFRGGGPPSLRNVANEEVET